jgi:hypothetical protein
MRSIASLLRTERAQVLVCPGELAGGGRRLVLERSAGGPLWAPALDALPGFLSALGARRADVSVTLSNRLVRYVALPASSALVREPDWRSFAERRLAALYGVEPGTQAILLSHRSAAARIACAVEGSLVEAIRASLQRAAHQLVSLQPHFAAAFDASRRQIGGSGAWFVNHEPEQLTIGLVLANEWRALRQRSVPADWAGGLRALLDREGQIAGIAGRIEKVVTASLYDTATREIEARAAA